MGVPAGSQMMSVTSVPSGYSSSRRNPRHPGSRPCTSQRLSRDLRVEEHDLPQVPDNAVFEVNRPALLQLQLIPGGEIGALLHLAAVRKAQLLVILAQGGVFAPAIEA